MSPLVSIIIPIFNRYHWVGRTLDSIWKQSFQDWECIVVDDGSTDFFSELSEFYTERDIRFKFISRPALKVKGANSCRNFGFKKSKGKYIQWFDSDDLMEPMFLEAKVKALEEHGVDFVISKTFNFTDPNPKEVIDVNENYYLFNVFPISNFNYVAQRINWLTCDFMGKREICQKVSFNENLTSSQEYNFFSKITCYSINGLVLDKYLTRRRVHQNSIRAGIRMKSGEEIEKVKELINLETWKDLAEINPGCEAEGYLLFKLIKLESKGMPSLKILWHLFYNLLRQGRINVAFFMMIYRITYSVSGRGYILRKRFIKELVV